MQDYLPPATRLTTQQVAQLMQTPAFEQIMKDRHIRYVSTPGARVFEGQIYNLSGLGSWETEASAQHEHFYYMYLAGIPLKVIRGGLGPKWSPPPRVGDPPA